MGDGTIKIGGASGYLGDADLATPQLLSVKDIDFIVYDYLAEITMSILARAKEKSPELGYTSDFIDAAMRKNLRDIAARGVKIISNAGGLNPVGCADALRAIIAEENLPLRVAVVTGDNLTDRAEEFSSADFSEMFSGAPFPAADSIKSINAYIGAFPIAAALDAGADIIITGRCVDSAVTLGACIHKFGWGAGDLDLLAAGSLAGHIIECGAQATGGNFTDWRDAVSDDRDIGYPVVEISADGAFICTKPDDTGGLVSVGTVGEQMLYEIGDPCAYLLPDVACDFSEVLLEDVGENRVRVSGAIGRSAPSTYKVCATFEDGWRAGGTWVFYGEDASEKAKAYGALVLARARRKLRALNAPDFEDAVIDTIGDESHYGVEAKVEGSREVVLKVAARHKDPRAVGMLLREYVGAALSGPPGLTGFTGVRMRPSPVVRLFSFLIDKSEVALRLTVDGESVPYQAPLPEAGLSTAPSLGHNERVEPPAIDDKQELQSVPLIALAFARSGDKGDKANIGILPRDKSYAPWIWNALTTEEVARRFSHFLKGDIDRYYLPGTGAINFLLHEALGGGGVVSLRDDPQGKGYGQILLQTPIPVPIAIAKRVTNAGL